jgi:hypothetical protein
MWGNVGYHGDEDRKKTPHFTVEIHTYFGLLQLLYYENKYPHSSVLHRLSLHTNINRKHIIISQSVWRSAGENFFLLSNATTCPYGLRGLPSWAWQ